MHIYKYIFRHMKYFNNFFEPHLENNKFYSYHNTYIFIIFTIISISNILLHATFFESN